MARMHFREQVTRRAEIEAKRADRRIARAERRAFDATDPATIEARAQARQLWDDTISRVSAIQSQILGIHPTFAGQLLIDSKIAHASDMQVLEDMGPGGFGSLDDVIKGDTAGYWRDAALRNCDAKVPGSPENLGAAVVWVERDRESAALCYRRKWFLAGTNTGHIGDAELYAVAAAMLLTIGEVLRGEGRIRRVRVLTDRRGLLETIANGRTYLGPFLSTELGGPKLALQDLHESAEWLAGQCVKFELAWVKGHGNSKGNKEADRWALHAAEAQGKITLEKLESGEEKIGPKKEAPVEYAEMGKVWEVEWLWRANKGLLVHKGKAIRLPRTGEEVQVEEEEDLGFGNLGKLGH